MSMAIKRASYTGDPGLFDIFKGAIGGAWAGLTGGAGRQPPIPTAGPGRVPLGRNFGPGNMGGNGFKLPGFMDPLGFTGPSWLDRGTAAPSMTEAGCPANLSGYHLNKSAYFLMSGEFVPAGSRYVRNRKRNPANARATSRAISRVVGAKRYATSLSRISVRKKC